MFPACILHGYQPYLLTSVCVDFAILLILAARLNKLPFRVEVPWPQRRWSGLWVTPHPMGRTTCPHTPHTVSLTLSLQTPLGVFHLSVRLNRVHKLGFGPSLSSLGNNIPGYLRVEKPSRCSRQLYGMSLVLENCSLGHVSISANKVEQADNRQQEKKRKGEEFFVTL